jgi:hypothetical protein
MFSIAFISFIREILHVFLFSIFSVNVMIAFISFIRVSKVKKPDHVIVSLNSVIDLHMHCVKILLKYIGKSQF